MSESNFKIALNTVASFLDPSRLSDIFRVLDPTWLLGEWGRPEIDEADRPKHLTLRIADNEDLEAIDAFFNSKRKQEADPKGFVKQRPDDPVEKMADRGHIVLLEDDEGITAICFAFVHDVEGMPGHEFPQKVTEIGTVISCAKGLGLTSIAISSLALVLHEQEGIDHPIIAKVSVENKAANGLFKDALKWDTTENYSQIKALFESSAGDTMRTDDNESKNNFEVRASRNWYVFGNKAQESAQDLLYALRKDRALIAKTGPDIPFEFDAEDFKFDLSLSEAMHEEPVGEKEPKLELDPDDPEMLAAALEDAIIHNGDLEPDEPRRTNDPDTLRNSLSDLEIRDSHAPEVLDADETSIDDIDDDKLDDETMPEEPDGPGPQ